MIPFDICNCGHPVSDHKFHEAFKLWYCDVKSENCLCSRTPGSCERCKSKTMEPYCDPCAETVRRELEAISLMNNSDVK